MSSELEVCWVFTSVEVIDICRISAISGSEKMSTVTELDFLALFDLDALGHLQLLGKDVENHDLILDGHDDMESTWVEGH